MEGYAEAFHEFIQFPAYQNEISVNTHDIETLFKILIEVMMQNAICGGCEIHREETLKEIPIGGSYTKTRPDFIFDTKNNRIFVEFKFRSTRTKFISDDFEQYRKYKFHTCEIRHFNGVEAKKK